MIAPGRRWRPSLCARLRRANIAIRATAASTPRPSPATPADRRRPLVRLDGGVATFDQHSMLDERRRGGRPDPDGRNRRDQRTRRLSSRLRCNERGYGRAASPVEATRCEALRADGARSRYHSALLLRRSEEERQLTSPPAPIVLLAAEGPKRLPDAIAPGLSTLGFMLPTTPLHLLVLRDMNHPVVMTSGNLSDEPQVIDDARRATAWPESRSYALVHDRQIANRVDDSVVRVDGGPRPHFTSRPGFCARPDSAAAGLRIGTRACWPWVGN